VRSLRNEYIPFYFDVDMLLYILNLRCPRGW